MRQPLPPQRTAVGLYRSSYFGDGDLHLREFLPQTTSAEQVPTPKRAHLTTAFRRFRDVDQSDSAIRLGKSRLDAIDPASDIGADVDFACLCLNAHHTLRVQPPAALLDHVAEVCVPRIKSSVQLETIVSAFHDMADATRNRDLLSALVPRLDELSATMRKETVVLLTTRLVDAGVAPAHLLQSLQERAVMLVNGMTFHEIAQLALSFAVAPTRPDDVQEVFEEEFAPQLLRKIDFAFAQDLASVLYAFAEVRVPVPELVAQCASRVYQLHGELDADGVAMTFTALALMDIRAPKLTKALVALTKELDLSNVTAYAALDTAHAMVHLGAVDETVLTMLTGRVMAERAAVLASPAARRRLVELSDRLSASSEQQQAGTAADPKLPSR